MNSANQKHELMDDRSFDKAVRPASHEAYHFLSDLQQRMRQPQKPPSMPVPAIMGSAQCAYVQNLATRRVTGSAGTYAMLGYSEAEFGSLGLAGILHAADQAMVKALMSMAEDHVVVWDAAGLLSFSCRVLGKSGECRKVLVQLSVERYFRESPVVYGSALISDISFLKAGAQVEWSFDAPGFDPEQIHMYIPQPVSPFFSTREIEVLELIDKGLTSQAIANALFISKHTVDTHRRKMLQKTGCPNAIALLEFYRSSQL